MSAQYKLFPAASMNLNNIAEDFYLNDSASKSFRLVR